MAYIDVDKFAEEICKFPAIDEHSANAVVSLLRSQPTADVVEVKQIEIIRDDLKWWLETNSEKGVVHIPKYVAENMIAKMDGERKGAE